MSIEEIKRAIADAKWFSALGGFSEAEGTLAISDLHAWDSETFAVGVDARHASIASNMDWLPSSREQEDPIYGRQLHELVEASGIDYSVAVRDVYKKALESLRSVPDDLIRSGPNDFTKAAVGSALYCVRMATLETLVNKPGFWSELLALYRDGFWPCGLMPDKVLVVY